jgi:hypothetical protein
MMMENLTGFRMVLNRDVLAHNPEVAGSCKGLRGRGSPKWLVKPSDRTYGAASQADGADDRSCALPLARPVELGSAHWLLGQVRVSLLVMTSPGPLRLSLTAGAFAVGIDAVISRVCCRGSSRLWPVQRCGWAADQGAALPDSPARTAPDGWRC